MNKYLEHIDMLLAVIEAKGLVTVSANRGTWGTLLGKLPEDGEKFTVTKPAKGKSPETKYEPSIKTDNLIPTALYIVTPNE